MTRVRRTHTQLLGPILCHVRPTPGQVQLTGPRQLGVGGRCRSPRPRFRLQAVVGDVTYKLSPSGQARSADYFQLLSYCTVLGLREGVLIYAQVDDGDPPPRPPRHTGGEVASLGTGSPRGLPRWTRTSATRSRIGGCRASGDWMGWLRRRAHRPPWGSALDHLPDELPGLYTPLFFHDEAVALAAGHRPCAECRQDRYDGFLDRWEAVTGERLTRWTSSCTTAA